MALRPADSCFKSVLFVCKGDQHRQQDLRGLQAGRVANSASITGQDLFAYPVQVAATPSCPDLNRVAQRHALTDTLPSADRCCPGYRDAGTGHSRSQGTF